jgi:hypothetical protein
MGPSGGPARRGPVEHPGDRRVPQLPPRWRRDRRAHYVLGASAALDAAERRGGWRPAAGVAFGLATSAAYGCFLLILRQTVGQERHVAGQLSST